MISFYITKYYTHTHINVLVQFTKERESAGHLDMGWNTTISDRLNPYQYNDDESLSFEGNQKKLLRKVNKNFNYIILRFLFR